MKVNVVLVDDDPIVLESVSQYLNYHDYIEILGMYNRAEDYLAALKKKELSAEHILLLDIGLPGLGGLEAISEIKMIADPEIIMLSTYEEEDKILRALTLGATSYISKRAGLKAILEGILVVKEGGAYLSPVIAREIVKHFNQVIPKFEIPERQKQILHALNEGGSYQSIATEMNISVETVRSHVKKMYRNLQVSNKTEAINLYHRGGIK